jgi:hypothetical protein
LYALPDKAGVILDVLDQLECADEVEWVVVGDH